MDVNRVVQICKGDVGALMVLRRLVGGYPDCYEIIDWLEKEGHTGEKLWTLYKDVYRENIEHLVRAIRTNVSGSTAPLANKGKQVISI